MTTAHEFDHAPTGATATHYPDGLTAIKIHDTWEIDLGDGTTARDGAALEKWGFALDEIQGNTYTGREPLGDSDSIRNAILAVAHEQRTANLLALLPYATPEALPGIRSAIEDALGMVTRHYPGGLIDVAHILGTRLEDSAQT